MEINYSRYGSSIVVAASGQLDINSSENLTTQCTLLIEQGDTSLVLDLSQLRYLSSAGIRAILMIERKAKERGGSLALCAPSEPAKMVLTMAGLLDQFKVYQSLSELR